MNELEEHAELPAGAARVEEYSRYYALGDHGDYLAVYLLGKNDRGIIEQRWLPDRTYLPFINGGGCHEVNITFDRLTLRTERAACNPATLSKPRAAPQ